MKMRADGSVRVLNDAQITELVEQLTKRVLSALVGKKRPKNEDVRDLVALAQTIPQERQYWRALLSKRDEEVERHRQAFHHREDYILELKFRLNVWPQEQDAKIKELKQQMRELEEDCANEVAEAKAETEKLIAALGQWAYEQGLVPEVESGA